MMKSFEEFQTYGKGSLEACTACGSALTKGFQAIAQENAEFARKSFEKNSEIVERVSATKSFDKAMEVQQGYAKEAYEAFVGQMPRLASFMWQPPRKPISRSRQALRLSASSRQPSK